MEKIRKGDDVVVIAGKSKGTRGKVLRVIPAKSRVLVSGVNVVTKHVKPTRQTNAAASSVVKPRFTFLT
jgi:large subunit ribosomal protein L24